MRSNDFTLFMCVMREFQTIAVIQYHVLSEKSSTMRNYLYFSLSLCRQLMENQIGAIERGAFDDMKELERL